MAHVEPSEYAFHGREGPYNVNGPPDYFGGQADQNPAFHRPHAVSRSFPNSNSPEDASALADALAGIDISQSARPNKELVVQAIDVAATVLRDQASALRDQISENEQLRSALRVREWELQNYKVDQGVGSRHGETRSRDDFQTLPSSQHLGTATSERRGLMQGSDQFSLSRDSLPGNGIPEDPQSSLIVHPSTQRVSETHYRYPTNGLQGLHYGSNYGVNGTSRPIHHLDVGYSQTSSPSARSTSPIRYGREGDPDSRVQFGGQGITHNPAETNTSNGLWLQEIVQRTPKPQEENKQLKILLTDAKRKEMQLVREKYRLEKLLSELRLTIGKYQEELVEAASREAIIQQEALEENAQLTSDLQAAEEYIKFYASSLLPLLAEFNLQPATSDPHSIVSGIKALVQHLRDEGRRDTHANRQSWRNSPSYQSPQQFAPNSPLHPMSRVMQSPENRGLEIVPQGLYSQPERPLSPSSPLSRTPRGWELSGASNQHHPFSMAEQTGEPPFTNSHGISLDYGTPVHQHIDESLYGNASDNSNTMGQPYGPDFHDKVEQPSPQLPTLPEEPTSSLSDEEDPLPDIEGLSINGDAVLGKKISATGFSINGTTLCHFQWVRHYRNGSFFHIQGAAQPEYTITADDIDTILSLECTPMDERNRKGEMVKVFVNNQNFITLEMDVQEKLSDYLDAGQATFEVKLVVENYQDISYDPALLTLKQNLYELKRINGRRVVVSEKYAESAAKIHVVPGKNSQCGIPSNSGTIHLLECDDSRTRDLVVLTMRQFIQAAGDRKRAKKKLWLSKK